MFARGAEGRVAPELATEIATAVATDVSTPRTVEDVTIASGAASAALPLVLRMGRSDGLPLHIPHRIGTAFAQRHDVVLDPARAGAIALPGRWAGIQSLEFLRHPAAALIVVRVRGGAGLRADRESDPLTRE